jgi:hypothetical protein
MSAYQVVLMTRRQLENGADPKPVTGYAMGVVFQDGISEPCSRRKARAWGARGFLFGTVEEMKPILEKIKRGGLPRFPTEEELSVLEVPASFEEVAPSHNDRIKAMKEAGYDPYEVFSTLNGEKTLKLYYVLEEGEGVLEDLALAPEPAEEDAAEEVASDGTSAPESADDIEAPDEGA